MSKRLYRSDRRICAEGVADFSLCGDAYEGDDDLAPVVAEWTRGPITCPGCCDVIRGVREGYRGVRLKPNEDGRPG